jgi:hypothetical protein
LGNALRPTNEVVDKGANHVRENDDHDPNNLVISLARLFRRALHDHPNPEHQGGDSKKEEEQHETGPKHSHPPNPNGFGLARRIQKLQTPFYTARFRTLPCPACRRIFLLAAGFNLDWKNRTLKLFTQAAWHHLFVPPV